MGLLSSYPLDTTVLKIRIITEEVIDRTKPWVFFDGSTSRNPKICGAGGIRFLKDDHYITFKAGLGEGTNNFAELYALKLLISLSLKKQIKHIQIFGDSMLVINWISVNLEFIKFSLLSFFKRLSDLLTFLIRLFLNMFIGKEIHVLIS